MFRTIALANLISLSLIISAWGSPKGFPEWEPLPDMKGEWIQIFKSGSKYEVFFGKTKYVCKSPYNNKYEGTWRLDRKTGILYTNGTDGDYKFKQKSSKVWVDTTGEWTLKRK